MPGQSKSWVEIVEQPFNAVFGRDVPLGFAVPAAGGGVVDQLLFDVEAGL
jgi:hypothetical protein